MEMAYSSLFLDVLVGLALLIALLIGLKRGLMRSLMGMAVTVASLLGAAWCASKLTQPLCGVLEPIVEKRIAAQSPLAGLNLQLPDFLSGLLSSFKETGHEFLMEKILEMLQPIVHAAVYLLAFVLLMVVLRLLSKLLRIVEKLPVIKSCNKLGGAVLGLLSGAAIVFVVLWAAEQFRWLPPEMLANSYFAKYFMLSTWL